MSRALRNISDGFLSGGFFLLENFSSSFFQAATCYKVAHAYPEALNAQDRACECYKECKSLFHAAKMLEQSVLVCKDSNQFDKITSFAERGALLYR